MRKEKLPPDAGMGYHDYTSAALHSKDSTAYGYLTFDSGIMGVWMGMPEDQDLPSTFSVEYVRAWKK
jgi:hypothetical protein